MGTLEEGVARLRDGRLDLLIGDTPILDYYRANDPGCTLRTVDVIEEDNYAVGMSKGLRLQVSISSLISSYSTSGYLDSCEASGTALCLVTARPTTPIGLNRWGYRLSPGFSSC